MTMNPFFGLRAAVDAVAELSKGRPTSILMSTADHEALQAGTLARVPDEIAAAVKRYTSGLPAYFGIPIHIDETCERPRLNWRHCPVCYPDQPEWATPDHCPTHVDAER